jgi:hypothetical protein
MGVLRTRRHWRPVSTFVTVMLLAAALLTLVHWHQDSPGQRCEVCFARNLPGIHVPFAARLAAPTRIEWWTHTEKPLSARAVSFQSKTSRAPPRISSL